MFSIKFPRMLVWLVLTIVLIGVTLLLQAAAPGNLLAVTLYKMHLLALAGWGGYWLDRALFPYDRPHCYLEDEAPSVLKNARMGGEPEPDQTELDLQFVASRSMASAQLRRAIVVASCIVGVCLGA